MNNFRFTKIVAGVSPTLAKETVLSKIINMVDVFRITLSKGYDDNNKKYIDTLMKLDNSKTIILETRGIDIRVKNTANIPVKVWDKWTFEYSEYTQDTDARIYVDYLDLWNLNEGDEIYAQQSGIVFKVMRAYGDIAETEVVKADRNELLHFDRIWFKGLEAEFYSLSERDKKDVLWGLEYGAHIIGLACASNAEQIESVRTFLDWNNAKNMKVFSKIETKTWLDNLIEVVEASDGIIFAPDLCDVCQDPEVILSTVRTIKQMGKPVLMSFSKVPYGEGYMEYFNQRIEPLYNEGIDGVLMDTFVLEDNVYETIENVGDRLNVLEDSMQPKELVRFDSKDDFEVRDYIIYNAFRATKELDITAIICFSESGYTAARLASLTPNIPIIAFTQSTETYRFFSLVWGTKGYKISQSFNYENLKRIGKEMIRIIFKWNISLDDKILIVQANESINGEKTDMINGSEIYNFKNI